MIASFNALISGVILFITRFHLVIGAVVTYTISTGCNWNCVAMIIAVASLAFSWYRRAIFSLFVPVGLMTKIPDASA